MARTRGAAPGVVDPGRHVNRLAFFGRGRIHYEAVGGDDEVRGKAPLEAAEHQGRLEAAAFPTAISELGRLEPCDGAFDGIRRGRRRPQEHGQSERRRVGRARAVPEAMVRVLAREQSAEA